MTAHDGTGKKKNSGVSLFFLSFFFYVHSYQIFPSAFACFLFLVACWLVVFFFAIRRGFDLIWFDSIRYDSPYIILYIRYGHRVGRVEQSMFSQEKVIHLLSCVLKVLVLPWKNSPEYRNFGLLSSSSNFPCVFEQKMVRKTIPPSPL